MTSILTGKEIEFETSKTPQCVNKRTQTRVHEEYESFQANVNSVRKNAIHIVDGDSANGVGKIICHDKSSIEGYYWFERSERDNKGNVIPVLYYVKRLRIRDDKNHWELVQTSSFI
jgi:hypothetical protein